MAKKSRGSVWDLFKDRIYMSIFIVLSVRIGANIEVGSEYIFVSKLATFVSECKNVILISNFQQISHVFHFNSYN